jgi:hypothetical protein
MEQMIRGDYAYHLRPMAVGLRATLSSFTATGSPPGVACPGRGIEGPGNSLALDLPGHGRSGGAARRRVEECCRGDRFYHGHRRAEPHPLRLSWAAPLPSSCCSTILRASGGIITVRGPGLVLPSLFEMIDTSMPAYVEAIGRLGFSEKTPPSVKLPFLRIA